MIELDYKGLGGLALAMVLILIYSWPRPSTLNFAKADLLFVVCNKTGMGTLPWARRKKIYQIFSFGFGEEGGVLTYHCYQLL